MNTTTATPAPPAICTACYAEWVDERRVQILRTHGSAPVCLSCGDARARKVQRTVVPLHKSNYVMLTDPEDLMGINNKGGLTR